LKFRIIAICGAGRPVKYWKFPILKPFFQITIHFFSNIKKWYIKTRMTKTRINEGKIRPEFRTKWLEECGIKVQSRDKQSGNVMSVACQFCMAFGKESDENDNRKRKRTENIQTFEAPWRSDKFKLHLNKMHSAKWAEYQTLSSNAKKLFFEHDLQVNRSKSPFLDEESKELYFEIDKAIVDEIMTKILFENEDDEDEEVIHASKMSRLFHAVHNDEEDVLYYRGRVSNAFQYKMALKYVGEGLSF
jgi:hypothetical protein